MEYNSFPDKTTDNYTTFWINKYVEAENSINVITQRKEFCTTEK
jgi:hypothetical protein